MKYNVYTDFGFDSSIRLPFGAWTNRYSNTQSQMQMIAVFTLWLFLAWVTSMPALIRTGGNAC